MALLCSQCGQYYDPGDPTKIIGCDCDGAEVARAKKIDEQIRKALEPKLRVRSISRVADNAQVLALGFDRKPTDDEMRAIHDALLEKFGQPPFPCELLR